MSRKTIAIDLDDVLTETASEFIAFCNKEWGLNLTVEDYDEHLARMWKIDESEAEKRVNAYLESRIYSHYPHNKGAFEVLSKLSKKYTLVIVTSRNQSIEEMTRRWLSERFGNIFADVRFTGFWDDRSVKDHFKMTKAALCQEIGASYLIDDQPKHCRGAAEIGVKSLVFGDYPWNRTIKLIPNMVKVKNWREVEAYFDSQITG